MTVKCKVCGDEFTEEDLQDLKDMHEDFFRIDDDFIICPDCWDEISHKDLEDYIETMLKLGGMKDV